MSYPRKQKSFPEIDAPLLLPLLEKGTGVYDPFMMPLQISNKKQSIISSISLTKGMVQKGQRIISKGRIGH